MSQPHPPVWQVGDDVYVLRPDPSGGREVILCIGRVFRIDGEILQLETTKGIRTWNAQQWPAFSTREAAEAHRASDVRSGGDEPLAPLSRR